MTSDITFCIGLDCPIKETCNRYRIQGKVGDDVYYFASETSQFTTPYNKDKKECEFLILKPKENESIS